MTRREKVDALNKEIEKLRKKIRVLQETCPHHPWMIDVKHGSSTGNYDPSCDRYWTDCHCRDCDKSWTEEGSSRKTYSSKKDYENDQNRTKMFNDKMGKLIDHVKAGKPISMFGRNHTDW